MHINKNKRSYKKYLREKNEKSFNFKTYNNYVESVGVKWVFEGKIDPALESESLKRQLLLVNISLAVESDIKGSFVTVPCIGENKDFD